MRQALRQLSLTSAAVLAACVAVPTQQVDLAYSEEVFAPYKAKGSEIVSGQAFLRQQGGGVVVCAGEPVLLLPAAGPIKEAVTLSRKGVRPLAGKKTVGQTFYSDTADPRFAEVVRRTQCDAQGNFQFAGVPAGDWYVYTRVQWIIADEPQGGDLLADVRTTGQGEQKVLLSDSNRV